MIFSEIQTSHTEPEVGTMIDKMKTSPSVILGILIILLLSTISMVFGLIVAVANPKKGLVDLLLRTRLMPE